MILSTRSQVIGALLVLPILCYLALGGYAMWTSGLFVWSWVFLPLSWLAAWLVGRFWKPTDLAEREPIQAAGHWTKRDQAAAEIIRQRQQRVHELTPAQLTDPHFYVEQVKGLAMELAAHYHPQTTDPYSSLKVPEVMAAVRLAVDDLESLAIHAIPGSQWLTIGQWKALQDAPKWIRRVQDSVWFASILLNPANIARYYVSKATVEPLSGQIQTEILSTIYLRFIRQVGFYLIEMNSGRLRGGADVYRQRFGNRPASWSGFGNDPIGSAESHASVEGQAASSTYTDAAYSASKNTRGDAAGQTRSIPSENVTIALVGQVSSGKSSLVNALLGNQVAASDILPTTTHLQRYQLSINASGGAVELLDTPGYGEAGASAGQIKQITLGLQQADAVLLILAANSPAKKADVNTLQQVQRFYQINPQLKQAPVIAVLTHVDLLSPVMQWQPPYQWKDPQNDKAKSIHAAVEYAYEIFEDQVKMVVPACTDPRPDRQWGIVEEVMPALSSVLSDAQSAAILRAFEQELDRDKWWRLFDQVKQSGMILGRYWLEHRAQR